MPTQWPSSGPGGGVYLQIDRYVLCLKEGRYQIMVMCDDSDIT